MLKRGALRLAQRLNRAQLKLARRLGLTTEVLVSDRALEYGFVFRELDCPPGARVLDVGFANSPVAFILAALGYEVYATDILPVDQRYPGLKIYQEDVRSTSFPDDHFDAVVAVSTIEHVGLSGRYTAVEDREGDRIAMAELRRILKPGGILVCTSPFGRAKVERPLHRIYDKTQVERLLEGFEVVKMEYAKEARPALWRPASLDEVQDVDGYHACVLVKAVKPVRAGRGGSGAGG